MAWSGKSPGFLSIQRYSLGVYSEAQIEALPIKPAVVQTLQRRSTAWPNRWMVFSCWTCDVKICWVFWWNVGWKYVWKYVGFFSGEMMGEMMDEHEMWKMDVVDGEKSGQATLPPGFGYLPCCSAHCKGCFICGADQSWDSCCVAAAIFAEVAGWLLLLRAMLKTFHMRQGSIMRFILRGRRNICWSCRMTLVAPHNVNDPSYIMSATL